MINARLREQRQRSTINGNGMITGRIKLNKLGVSHFADQCQVNCQGFEPEASLWDASSYDTAQLVATAADHKGGWNTLLFHIIFLLFSFLYAFSAVQLPLL
jgi:hypothetical protein